MTIDQLAENTQVRHAYPALAQAAEGVTSPQIRAMGTVGGDLCQRPRCWYFRAGLRAAGQRMKAAQRSFPTATTAITQSSGNDGPALFVNPSTLAPALIALMAKIKVYGAKGERTLAADQFFLTPRSDGEREYALKPGEIVTEITIPPVGGIKSATYEVRQKEALDWPLAAAAVALQLNGKTVKSARIVLGHVAPVPWLSPAAAEALVGKQISEETANGGRQGSRVAGEGAQPERLQGAAREGGRQARHSAGSRIVSLSSLRFFFCVFASLREEYPGQASCEILLTQRRKDAKKNRKEELAQDSENKP